MSNSMRSMAGIIAGVTIGVAVGVIGYRAFVSSEEAVEKPAAEQPASPTPADEEIPVEPAGTADPPDSMVTPPAEPAPAPEPITEPVAEAEPEEPEADPNQGRAERVAQAQMKILSDMIYKPFYDEVSLDPGTREAAAELFAENFRKQQSVQQAAMMKGDRVASDIKAETDALRDELRDRLVEVLNDDQLEAWEEYDAYSDRVLFEALLDGQLRMLAPDLNIESHQTTMAVMAERLAQSIEAFEDSSEVYSMDNFNDAQLAGLNDAMQDLRSELDAGQAAHAQGFVDQVKVMFDAMKTQSEAP